MVRFGCIITFLSLYSFVGVIFGGALHASQAFVPTARQVSLQRRSTIAGRRYDARRPTTISGRIPRGGGGGGSMVTSSSSFLDLISNTKWKCWVALMASIMVEILGSALMKAARVKQSAALLVLAFVLFWLGNAGFFVAVTKIELGIAYAVWSALGTLVLTIVGVVWFGEPYDAIKLGSLLLIVIGVVGLNLRGDH